MAGLKDGLLDVAFMDASIVDKDGEASGGVEGGEGEEVDEEFTKAITINTARGRSCLLLAALVDELMLGFSDFDFVVEEAERG